MKNKEQIKKSKTLIIVPAYNAEEFMERTLDSCIDQKLPTEVWVVDNCSTDKTQDFVKEYLKQNKRVKLVVNEKNLGRTGNWNRCLELFEKSEYEYIKYVFTGDELLPNCIKEIEKAFAVDSEIGAVAFPYDFVDLSGIKHSSGHTTFGLISNYEINRINLEEGGLLGAIVCNAYNKKFIDGYRFNEIFIGKSDFDYKFLSTCKAFYINEVLAIFNLDAHRTFKKALDYRTEAEVVFNRAYWLEKLKHKFSNKKYRQIREKIFLDFIRRNNSYYGKRVFFKLLLLVVKIIFNRFFLYVKRITRRVIKSVGSKKL